ncbi:hypothetical protein HY605_00920 [Candidatus Peregrinibacteria bacterium]|nr:hypothetical protein [Candidatus Peregrinibacteria bacterium]
MPEKILYCFFGILLHSLINDALLCHDSPLLATAKGWPKYILGVLGRTE